MDKKEEKTPQKEQPKKEKKKMSRFGKLYIVTAIGTACICLVVLAVTTQISRSVLKWDEKTPVSLPTPVPVDSLLSKTIVLPTAAPPTQAPAPTAAPQTPAPVSSVAPQEESDDDEVVETGLFGKKETFTLCLPLSGEILNECSLDRLKKSKTLGDWRTHNGVDIKADAGTAVNAAADGTVVRAEYDNSMGYVICIAHKGQYQTLYANLASYEMVEVGQEIKAGECLGAVGDSAVFEKLEESHLHFELTENGVYKNPLDYLA